MNPSDSKFHRDFPCSTSSGLSMFYEQCTVSMQSHRYTLKKHGAAIALEFNFSSKFSQTVEKPDCARKKKAPRAAGRHFPSQLNDQRGGHIRRTLQKNGLLRTSENRLLRTSENRLVRSILISSTSLMSSRGRRSQRHACSRHRVPLPAARELRAA